MAKKRYRSGRPLGRQQDPAHQAVALAESATIVSVTGYVVVKRKAVTEKITFKTLDQLAKLVEQLSTDHGSNHP